MYVWLIIVIMIIIYMKLGGIAFEEFVDFFSFLHTINEVEAALTFYHVAGAAIDKGKRDCHGCIGRTVGPLNVKGLEYSYSLSIESW